MEKFEYKVIVQNDLIVFENYLNQIGKEGWELVNFICDDDDYYTACLKRRIK